MKAFVAHVVIWIVAALLGQVTAQERRMQAFPQGPPGVPFDPRFSMNNGNGFNQPNANNFNPNINVPQVNLPQEAIDQNNPTPNPQGVTPATPSDAVHPKTAAPVDPGANSNPAPVPAPPAAPANPVVNAPPVNVTHSTSTSSSSSRSSEVVGSDTKKHDSSSSQGSAGAKDKKKAKSMAPTHGCSLLSACVLAIMVGMMAV